MKRYNEKMEPQKSEGGKPTTDRSVSENAHRFIGRINLAEIELTTT